jgi:hypothetical protein
LHLPKSRRKGVALWRWVTMSGLADLDHRFFVARFNLGMVTRSEKPDRSLHYFRS